MQRMTKWLKRRKYFRVTPSYPPVLLRHFDHRSKLHLSTFSIKPSSFIRLYHHRRITTSKKLVQATGIVLLSLPAKSIDLTAMPPTLALIDPIAYDSVLSTNKLVIASVPGDSTYFSTDGFQHGFGYDLTRAYAATLNTEQNIKIEVVAYDNSAEALKAVQMGKADMALTTAKLQQTNNAGLAAVKVSCGIDQELLENGLHPSTNWSFRSSDDPLAIHANNFSCTEDQLITTAKIADFYDQSLLQDDYNRSHFEKAIDSKLPNFKAAFQKHADTHDLDWQLLVAMGYQESHLNANAVSPTGVKGLMMLTNSTAKAMGVSNRVDPHQSIVGGARYFGKMQDLFADVPNPDRLWFSLASYNMGPNAVKKIQRKLDAQGKDPNSWSNIYAYMSDNAGSNSRYGQCMHYVTNIRSYLESLKTSSV